ncbi:MAG: hypothetical protein LLG00_14615 [Planctomycetaceae bacterium]|nr:hypothetical protein [Planctomycetaceae bacterium]
MNFTLIGVALLALAVEKPAAENPVFRELLDRGITASDGTVLRLPKPIVADGLDAAGQRAAMEKAPNRRRSVVELTGKSYYTPVEISIRNLTPAKDERPIVRAVDIWFVVHGDWDLLNSKGFIESVMKTGENAKSHVVLKSGFLTEKELASRKLTATVKQNSEERFVYSTIDLFDLVQVSATRFTVLTKGNESIVAAGRLDPRFATDPEYPNQWRPLVRDAQANIRPGKPHPFAHAGGYAKITRLKSPANAALIECHMVYEEDYGWFEGVNLVKQKVPAMVQEKVRVFRRKLTVATAEKAGKKE